jgi:F-type H+-transporting ATPase subunit delta
MKASRTRIASVIADQSLKDGFGKRQATAIAAYLLETGRVNELDPLLRDVQADWARHGFVEAIAVSAHELSDQVRRDVTATVRKLYPDAKHIEITTKLDPTIVGGIRLEFSSRQLDLSIQHELNKFKSLAVNGKD